ncbi:MAG: hypothetical protein GY953_11235 [bacterium]|nr:hypothetical protein [bacterium]
MRHSNGGMVPPTLDGGHPLGEALTLPELIDDREAVASGQAMRLGVGIDGSICLT